MVASAFHVYVHNLIINLSFQALDGKYHLHMGPNSLTYPVGCLQVVGAHSKATRERHWHGAVPLAIAAVSMAALALLLTAIPWLAFCCMVLAMAGADAIQGPTWTWPAVLLRKEVAVMGTLLRLLSSNFGLHDALASDKAQCETLQALTCSQHAIRCAKPNDGK